MNNAIKGRKTERGEKGREYKVETWRKLEFRA
jgi:hypothetical protein